MRKFRRMLIWLVAFSLAFCVLFYISEEYSSYKEFVKPDDIELLASKNKDFIATWCEYTLKPVLTLPKMCIFDPNEDLYISQHVVKGSIWDQKGVATVLSHLTLLQSENVSPLFLDLGANIGTFSIPALTYGVETISVEPLASAMQRLATSIKVNEFPSRLFTLHRKAISDKHMCMRSVVNALNKGGSEVERVDCSNALGNRQGDVIKAISVDDLFAHRPRHSRKVVLKLDIQKYEPMAINGARKMFNKHNVTMVYMEWAEMRNALNSAEVESQTDRDYIDSVNKVMEFLVIEKKYNVYSKENLNQLSWPDRLHWSDNIFLVQPGIRDFQVVDQFPKPVKVA